MKSLILVALMSSGFAHATAAPICRDGNYMVGIPRAGSTGVAQILGSAQTANLLKVNSSRVSGDLNLFSVALNGPEGFQTLQTVAQLPGAIVECDSALGF